MPDFDVARYVELLSVVHQSVCLFPFGCSIGELMGSRLLHFLESGDDFSLLLTTFLNSFFDGIRTGNDCGRNLIKLMGYQYDLITVIIGVGYFGGGAPHKSI